MTDKPTEGAARKHSRDIVDESSDASFPASDPPSWGPLRVGTPDEFLGGDDTVLDTASVSSKKTNTIRNRRTLAP
ncbi:MAG: hypothetical protein ABJB66_20620 [Gemmatimonadaceae bacterium]